MNNGFFGFGTIEGYSKDYLTGLNNQNKSIIGMGDNSQAKAGAGAGAVAGLSLQDAGSFMDIFNQMSTIEGLASRGKEASEQFELQIKQIEGNQTIRDLASIKQANSAYATTLAKQGANSNISQTSSAFYGAFNDISKQLDVMNFSSNMTATTQKLNTYLQESNYFKDLQMKIKQSQNEIVGSAITSAVTTAALIALFV